MTSSRTTLPLAAVAFSAALALSGPLAFAQSAPSAAPRSATGSAPAEAPNAPPAPRGTSASHATAPANAGIEARITRLHRELKITSAQQSQWDQVAQIMRQNAEQMSTLIQQRNEAAQQPQAMNAVQNLQSYQQIADAHARGVDRLVPVFQTLYDQLSPAQKKTADALFNQRLARRGRATASRSTSHTTAGGHS